LEDKYYEINGSIFSVDLNMCGRKTLTRDMQSIIEELAIEEWYD